MLPTPSLFGLLDSSSIKARQLDMDNTIISWEVTMGSVKMIPSSSSIHLNHNKLVGLPSSSIHLDNPKECFEQQALISSLTLWHIWVARCYHRLEEEVIPLEIIVKNICIGLIYTLKGQFNALKDDSKNTMLVKLCPCQRWKNFNAFLWRYAENPLVLWPFQMVISCRFTSSYFSPLRYRKSNLVVVLIDSSLH